MSDHTETDDELLCRVAKLEATADHLETRLIERIEWQNTRIQQLEQRMTKLETNQYKR